MPHPPALPLTTGAAPPPRSRLSLADGLSVVVLALVPLVILATGRAQSATCDEVLRLGAGYSYLEHGAVLVSREHPPLAKLLVGASLHLAGVHERSGAATYARLERGYDAWGEFEYGERLTFSDNPEVHAPGLRAGAPSVLFFARAPLVLFALLAAASAWLWARGRWGPWGGLVALALVATYPDFLGHAALVTFDVPLAAWLLLAGLALDRTARGGGAWWVALLGLAIGGALATKLSAPFALVGVAAAALGALVRPIDPAPASPAHPLGSGPLAGRARAFGIATLGIGALAFVVLRASYLGTNPLAGLAHAVSILRSLHVPPYDGIFLGERCVGPWWVYFPVVVALKAPLGTLALLGLAVVALRREGRGTWQEEAILHAPLVSFYVFTAALAQPYGSRYMIPVVLLACVSAGRLAVWAKGSRARTGLVVVALAANVLGVAREHPFHQSATNLLAGPRELVYRRFDESVQDWGGGLDALAAWQRARGVPRVHVLPFAARPFTRVLGGSASPYAVSILPSNVYSWTAHLEAWGVVGDVVRGDALFRPQRGEVYAISSHAAAWARVLEKDWQATAAARGERPPALVLGDEVLPSEVVGGGFLIFDLRNVR